MTVVTKLTVKVKTDTAKAAIAAFAERRIFAECGACIAGFIKGELMQSISEPEELLIIAHWRTAEDAASWLAHPVRAQQLQDLGHFAVSVSDTSGYTLTHEYAPPQSP